MSEFTARRGRLLQLGLLIVGVALALYRIPAREELRSIWAEDGPVFVQQARLHNFFHTLVTPYAGYLHVVPRIVAGISTLFPLGASSVVVNVGTAVLHGALALIVWHALRDVITHPLLRVVTPVLVCSAPVGAETAVSLANMQWSLQIAATVVAAFWTPKSKVGIALGVAVLFLTPLSTPFGFVLVLICVLRLCRWRSLITWSFLAAAVVGTALQGIAMARTHAPTGKSAAASSLPARYLRRAVGEVFVGDNSATNFSATAMLVIGCVLAVALLFVATAVWRAHDPAADGRKVIRRSGVLVLASLLFYFVPVYLKPPPVAEALAGSRYSLSPGVLLVAAFCVVADPLIRGACAERLPGRVVAGAKATVAVLFTLLAVSVVANQQSAMGHHRTDDWFATVRNARARCQAETPTTRTVLFISPRHWGVALPCSKVT